MSIVIVYGPQGCGKTRNSKQLLAHFKCRKIVDDWDGASRLTNGDLALTYCSPAPEGLASGLRNHQFDKPKFGYPNATVLHFDKAKRMLTRK